jgi:hypothetical protein
VTRCCVPTVDGLLCFETRLRLVLRMMHQCLFLCHKYLSCILHHSLLLFFSYLSRSRRHTRTHHHSTPRTDRCMYTLSFHHNINTHWMYTMIDGWPWSIYVSLSLLLLSPRSSLLPPRPAAHSRFLAFLCIIRWRTIVLFGWHLLRHPN